jgi:cytochrome bd-type quinol oxidase subunit 1
LSILEYVTILIVVTVLLLAFSAESSRDPGRVAFAAILACILVIAALIVAAVVLMRKITDEEPKDKGYVPEAVLERDDFADVNILEEQYSPHKRG